jgi:hypothetical protein
VNTVVPERHSRKRWGTPRGRAGFDVSSAERKGKAPPSEQGRGPGRVTVPQAHGLSKVEGRESIGAKGQWCSLVKGISHCKANTLQKCPGETPGTSEILLS